MCAQIKMCSNRKSIPLMASYLVLEERRTINKEIPKQWKYSHLLRKQAENNSKVAEINLSVLIQRRPIWLGHQA